MTRHTHRRTQAQCTDSSWQGQTGQLTHTLVTTLVVGCVCIGLAKSAWANASTDKSAVNDAVLKALSPSAGAYTQALPHLSLEVDLQNAPAQQTTQQTSQLAIVRILPHAPKADNTSSGNLPMTLSGQHASDQVPTQDGYDETVRTPSPSTLLPNQQAPNQNTTDQQGNAQENPTHNGGVGTALGDDLGVLNNSPDPLKGIEGLHPTRVPLGAVSPDTLQTFVAVVDLVRRQHISSVGDEMLFKHAMSGMLSRLDDHAEFLDATAFANLQSFTGGNLASVGISTEFSQKDNHWVITEVATGSSADIAGVEVGDYLHQIGEMRLNSNKTQNDVTQMLNGIAGTQLELVVSRAGRSKHTLYLQRNDEVVANLDVQMHDGIAVIRLPVFQDTTRQKLVDALIRINTPIQGMIIDVRNNPGGVLESALSLASLFLSDKGFVKIVGRDHNQILTTAKAANNQPTALANMPIVILQNRYSASAAEVLAAGMQANQRAIVMGETSYGKGSVQSVIPIGDAQAVKLTTAYYQKPNGDEIESIGVVPDIALAGNEAIWLVDALRYMNEHKLSTGVILSLSNDY